MACVARDRIVAGNRKRTLQSAACVGLAVIIAALILTSASAAHATMITVDTLTDGSVAGHCTLRDAITAANTMSAMNNCAGGTGSDTIVFSVTGTISLGSTLPTVTDANLTITGPISPGIKIDGGGLVQLMQVDARATLTLQFLTLANGRVTGASGGAGDGGAIFNQGTLTVTNSTFSANITINSPDNVGGAIGGTASLKGTILAASFADNCAPFGVTDAGYNISDDDSCGFSAITSKNSTVPKLAAGLASNGGPTKTIALLLGSPAVDAIPFASCTDASGKQLTTDQRGMPRPNPLDGSNGPCDIGAYEVQVEIFNAPPLMAANCHGKIVSALAQQFGALDAATSALGFPSVKALQTDIRAFCRA